MTDVGRLAREGGVPRAAEVLASLGRSVFRDVDLGGRRVLDIGGGNGLHSFWAVAVGRASSAVVLDPYVEGSNPRMAGEFARMRACLDDPDAVRLARETLEEHGSSGYDVAIMHNSVNHIDEAGTAALPDDEAARGRFVAYFRRLAGVLAPTGILVLSDSSRRNLFGDLRLRNPFAPQLEWRIHQPPKVWERLMGEAGFAIVRRAWTSGASRGGSIGRLLSTRAGAYATTSHFTIVARRGR